MLSFTDRLAAATETYVAVVAAAFSTETALGDCTTRVSAGEGSSALREAASVSSWDFETIGVDQMESAAAML